MTEIIELSLVNYHSGTHIHGNLRGERGGGGVNQTNTSGGRTRANAV